MASIGQIQYNVKNSQGQLIGANKYDIFEQNLVAAYPANRFTKVGIQAEPGTKVRMSKDGNKVIMIGRTGIYELDDDIAIDYMQFEHPIEYQFNPDKTKELLDEGKQAIEDAEQWKRENVDNIDVNSSQAEWDKYVENQSIYLQKYDDALKLYKRGVNGWFDPVGAKDLDNVIIDFIYE